VRSTSSSTALGSGTNAFRRVPIVLLALAGMCVLFTVVGSGRVAAAHGSAPSAGAAVEGGIAWAGCGEALECARVRVPLDWDRPRGRTISLAVIRHLAGSPEQRIGSLFINPGGPGVSGVDAVRAGGAAQDAALGSGRFDVVSWDLRGSGRSTHVACFANQRRRARFWGDASIPTARGASRRLVARTVAFARRCGARSGGLLAHISTTDSVRDLDYLRRLVGDRQLTFYGASAGTFLGQVYANLFARRVRAMVLDGVVDPVAWTAGAEAAIANLRGDTDLVFEKFQSLCQSAGPALCALAGEGPAAPRVQKLLERLRRAPIPAPSATPAGRLTYGDALTAITLGVDAPAGWPELAAALEQAASGDGSTLATQARAGLAELRSADFEATEGIFCADSPARQGPHAWPAVVGRLTAVSRVGGPMYGWSLWAPCASWPARGADRYTGPWNATTENPILVTGPRFDPSTPFANARRAANRLGNALLLTQEGYGHLTSADPSACVKRAISAYLVDLVTPPPGTVCPSDRLPFDPDFTQPLP
jgi:pimeloyl-ACP methyl ester carboxylesterase